MRIHYRASGRRGGSRRRTETDMSNSDLWAAVTVPMGPSRLDVFVLFLVRLVHTIVDGAFVVGGSFYLWSPVRKVVC